MPELPEVEVVRRGLADHVAGRRIASVELRGTRVARRHVAGHEDLIGLLTGRVIGRARRRGKYLWLELADAADGPVEDALLLHLGMSGQLLVEVAAAPDEKHLHARFRFDDSGPELRFVDQRTFGGLAWSANGADGIPLTIAHIAPDPFEPAYDPNAVVRRIKAKDSEIKVQISTGPSKVKVPAVEGLTQSSAESQLLAAGLQVKVEFEPNADRVDKVISQDPKGGDEVDVNSTVTIKVGTAPVTTTTTQKDNGNNNSCKKKGDNCKKNSDCCNNLKCNNNNTCK